MLVVTATLSVVTSIVARQDPPRGSVDSCTTSECHADVTTHRHLHGPVDAGLCEVCHVATDPERHRFELTASGGDLCAECHDLIDAGAHAHAPLSEGRCDGCHDPHGSAFPMLLADEPVAICTSCHEDATPGAHAHASVGDCTQCHFAHASDHAALLRAPAGDLCVGCHADVTATPAGGRVHGPVVVDCLPCHDPHGTDEAAMLLLPANDLCASCHGPTGGHVASGERGCLECHGAHAGHGTGMLADEPVSLCLTCHAQGVTRADGSTVAAMTGLTLLDAHRHAPVDEEGCTGCHDMHDATHGRLLVRAHADAFYQAFDEQAYALCLGCHDAAAFREPRTTTLTAFRDGDRNLHAVHVAPAGGKGRSCGVCHDAHASRRPRLMRADAPFGEWRIPIGLELTDTGGSCAAGCHRAQSYDRGTLSPGGAPAPPSAGATGD